MWIPTKSFSNYLSRIAKGNNNTEIQFAINRQLFINQSTYSPFDFGIGYYNLGITSPNVQILRKNGVTITTETNPNSASVDANLITARAGVAANIYSEFTLKTLGSYENDTFDHLSHNTNVRLLVAGLQVNQLITDINDANNIIDNGLTTWP